MTPILKLLLFLLSQIFFLSCATREALLESESRNDQQDFINSSFNQNDNYESGNIEKVVISKETKVQQVETFLKVGTLPYAINEQISMELKEGRFSEELLKKLSRIPFSSEVIRVIEMLGNRYSGTIKNSNEVNKLLNSIVTSIKITNEKLSSNSIGENFDMASNENPMSLPSGFEPKNEAQAVKNDDLKEINNHLLTSGLSQEQFKIWINGRPVSNLNRANELLDGTQSYQFILATEKQTWISFCDPRRFKEIIYNANFNSKSENSRAADSNFKFRNGANDYSKKSFYIFSAVALSSIGIYLLYQSGYILTVHLPF